MTNTQRAEKIILDLWDTLYNSEENGEDNEKFNVDELAWAVRDGSHPVKVIDKFGGEGMGDHAHYVFEVTDGDEKILVKIDGYYDSWNGTEWQDDFYEVVPVEVKVIQYNPKV